MVVRSNQYEVSNESLRTLRPGSWLNDEIITAYVSLINQRLAKKMHQKTLCLNSYFMAKLESEISNSTYKFTRLEKWINRPIKSFNSFQKKTPARIKTLADLDYLMIPIN